MITCFAQTAQDEARLHSTLLFSGRHSKFGAEFQPSSHIGALFEQNRNTRGNRARVKFQGRCMWQQHLLRFELSRSERAVASFWRRNDVIPRPGSSGEMKKRDTLGADCSPDFELTEANETRR